MKQFGIALFYKNKKRIIAKEIFSFVGARMGGNALLKCPQQNKIFCFVVLLTCSWLRLKVGWGRETWDAGTRERGDAGTRGRGDAGTRGRGDAGTRGRGDAGTRGREDAGTRGRGDVRTGGCDKQTTPEFCAEFVIYKQTSS